jgi:hypothetical protein
LWLVSIAVGTSLPHLARMLLWTVRLHSV